MKHKILFFLLCTCFSVNAIFERDQFLALRQKEEWEQALTIINNLLIEDPHNSELLYHAGLVSYKLENLKQAQNYFDQATAQKNGSNEITFKSFYNAGNAFYHMKDFQS